MWKEEVLSMIIHVNKRWTLDYSLISKIIAWFCDLELELQCQIRISVANDRDLSMT